MNHRFLLLFSSIVLTTVIFTGVKAQSDSSSNTSSETLFTGTFEKVQSSWNFWPFKKRLGDFSLSDKNPKSGEKCAHITIKNVAEENWHVQLQKKNFPVKKNFIYRLSYWARGENNAGNLEVVFVKGSPPWTYYSGKKSKVTPQWKQYEMIFTSPVTSSDIQMAFQCAHQKGDYFIDDVTFTEIGKLDIKEVASDWYEKADERIDQIRKGDFTLEISDKDGKPYSGTVEVSLARHDFEWGTCLAMFKGDDPKYKKLALKHFNCGVFENAFKWEEYEKVKGKPNVDELKRYLKWSKKNDFPIRGHALIWGTENYGYNKHWARRGDDDFLKEAIKERITRDVSRYKGQIPEYDVWNEPVHENSIFTRLGWGILDSAFIWAHRADPQAKLFINEYSIISGGDAKQYRDLVKGMLQREVPVHGLGVQSHFSSRIDPCEIASKLNYMAELDLPIKVTEFDMDIKAMGMSSQEMAEDYAKMMRTAFSHPAIDGFYMWGFWDGGHWRPGAGIYDEKFNPKPAADSVYSLIHDVWTTKNTLPANETGEVNFRGFYGKYDLILKEGKKSRKLVVDFSKDSPRSQVLNLGKKK
ncbi:MAG: endo-1,4-beta-xylanase [Chitinispirillaceae bacterium]